MIKYYQIRYLWVIKKLKIIIKKVVFIHKIDKIGEAEIIYIMPGTMPATEEMQTTATPLSASVVANALRTIIKDFNYWGESESDSPLRISRTKNSLDEKRILSLDSSARARYLESLSGYKAPSDRGLQTKTLVEVFEPLVSNSISSLNSSLQQFKDGVVPMTELEMPAEAVEFYIQLYSAFTMLQETKVVYVDSPTDPYVGLFIIGNAGAETVYAQTLLVQT